MEVVKLSSINYNYKEKLVLDDISFSIKKSRIYGYLGPNGSGKTTTIKLILGLLRPKKGKLSLFNKDPYENNDIRSKVGFCLDSDGLYAELTALENLVYWGRLYGLTKDLANEKGKNLISLVNLNESENIKIGDFSLGMKKRISLARSLIADPDLLILDEPISGLDPESRILIRNILKNLQKEGKTIFFASHDLDEIEKIATDIIIIKNGKILFDGELNDVKLNLESFYLDLIK